MLSNQYPHYIINSNLEDGKRLVGDLCKRFEDYLKVALEKFPILSDKSLISCYKSPMHTKLASTNLQKIITR